jgi:hypothetical protein
VVLSSHDAEGVAEVHYDGALDRRVSIVHIRLMAACRVTLVKSKKSPMTGDDDRHAR